jgi:hypothetical protein
MYKKTKPGMNSSEVQRPPQHGDLLPEKSNTKKSQKTKHIQA